MYIYGIKFQYSMPLPYLWNKIPIFHAIAIVIYVNKTVLNITLQPLSSQKLMLWHSMLILKAIMEIN